MVYDGHLSFAHEHTLAGGTWRVAGYLTVVDKGKNS